MKKVVLLCRCSTDKEKGLQDYQYQIDTLKELCKKRDWDIVKIFGGMSVELHPLKQGKKSWI